MDNNLIINFFYRYLKNNNLFHLYYKLFYIKNNRIFKALLKNGYTSSLYNYILFKNDESLTYFNINLRECVAKFSNKIYSLNNNSIYIYDIKNHDKLSKYLDDNGLIWGSRTIYSEKDNRRTISRGYKYYILINKEGHIYFGSYYDEIEIKVKDDFAIKLKEKDFYEYWEKNKKEIYNNLVKDLNG
jgi:hypothetical protein